VVTPPPGNRATGQPGNRATGQPGNSAGNSILTAGLLSGTGTTIFRMAAIANRRIGTLHRTAGSCCRTVDRSNHAVPAPTAPPPVPTGWLELSAARQPHPAMRQGSSATPDYPATAPKTHSTVRFSP